MPTTLQDDIIGHIQPELVAGRPAMQQSTRLGVPFLRHMALKFQWVQSQAPRCTCQS